MRGRTPGSVTCEMSVICRVRAPVSCQSCADHLQVLYGAQVRLKHWTEAWRIRCVVCGNILSQDGEDAFERELGWHWYEAVITAADRGSTIVEDAIGRQRPAKNLCWHARRSRHDNPSLVPADVLWLFGFNSPDPSSPNTLSRLSFAQRLFLLAAIGARRHSEAEDARHLLRVANRRLLRQTNRRRRRRNAGSSLKITVSWRIHTKRMADIISACRR